MNDIRRNTISGVIEYTTLASDKTSYMAFNEWWNGEGLDFQFDDRLPIGLHIDDMHAMFVAAVASGYVEVDRVIAEAEELNRIGEKREKEIARIREKHISEGW